MFAGIVENQYRGMGWGNTLCPTSNPGVTYVLYR